ncbi:Gag/polymerase/env polyprotein [Penicillium bovifimosum]|uniref:Gag/polymerase/env polyprotein n=1 Tax=Penicillium bovifimosum TaxID=126998 RepID=A0A9W9KUY4_9EURO|nr:Gag/polymerase/env polyprotein [Penicillium bovifimosum]KAJ5120518.1 Gag/polymerase/env polyprotein [Penicillium bovifimosum]
MQTSTRFRKSRSRPHAENDNKGSHNTIRTTTPSGEQRQSLAYAERQALMKEGKCFVCRQQGHLSRDCPENNKDGKSGETKMATVSATERRLRDAEDSDSSSSSGNVVVPKLTPCGLRTKRLRQPQPLCAFDGRPANPITHGVRAPLIVGNRRQIDVPMLIAYTGRHDMILGRLWCADRGVTIDCKNLQLVWPEPARGEERKVMQEEVACQMTRPIPIQILRRPTEETSARHQKVADRRDTAFEKAEKFEASVERVDSTKNPSPTIRREYNHSHTEDTVKKMERALLGDSMPTMPERDTCPVGKERRTQRNTPKPMPQGFSIAAVGSAGFQLCAKQEGVETFATSIHAGKNILYGINGQHR